MPTVMRETCFIDTPMKEGAFDGASLTAIATPFAQKGLLFCRISTNVHTTQGQQKTKTEMSKM